MNHTTLKRINSLVLYGSEADLAEAIDLLKSDSGKTWPRIGTKLARWADTGQVNWSIWTEGNSKLPFLSFSALPGETCPGAGDCLNWCYSFTSWRNGYPWFRQLMNTWLIRNDFGKIAESLDRHLKRKKYAGRTVDVRLYVDGDIDSTETLAKWCGLLMSRPQIRAYGYSKSMTIFNEYRGEIPPNYVLNVSSGHKWDDSVEEAFSKHPYVRGRFVGVKVEGAKVSGFAVKDKDVKAAVREAYGKKKSFVCPGQCGDCTPRGHACGILTMTADIITVLH